MPITKEYGKEKKRIETDACGNLQKNKERKLETRKVRIEREVGRTRATAQGLTSHPPRSPTRRELYPNSDNTEAAERHLLWYFRQLKLKPIWFKNHSSPKEGEKKTGSNIFTEWFWMNTYAVSKFPKVQSNESKQLSSVCHQQMVSIIGECHLSLA